MTFMFCPNCGDKLVEKSIGDEGKTPFCEACNRPWFSFSYPCVICLCVDETNNVALIKQSYVSEHFVCVAGYVKQGETIENAAKREVEEETGLRVLSVKYINSYYYPKSDNIMLGFVCKVEHAAFHISSEVELAEWFTPADAEEQLRQGSVGPQLLHDYIHGI